MFFKKKKRVAFFPPCFIRSQRFVHLVCSLYTVDLIIHAIAVISIAVKLSHKLLRNCRRFFLVVNVSVEPPLKVESDLF